MKYFVSVLVTWTFDGGTEIAQVLFKKYVDLFLEVHTGLERFQGE